MANVFDASVLYTLVYTCINFVYNSVLFYYNKSRKNVTKFQRLKKTKTRHTPHLKAHLSPGSPFSLVLFMLSPAPAGSRDGNAWPGLI